MKMKQKINMNGLSMKERKKIICIVGYEANIVGLTNNESGINVSHRASLSERRERASETCLFMAMSWPKAQNLYTYIR